MSWTRIDDIKDLNYFYDFDYIREEAELHRDKEEWEVLCEVNDTFLRDFPELFENIRYSDAVDIEYHPFELDTSDEYDMKLFNEYGRPGYAIYIYFGEEFINLNFPDLLELNI